MKINYNVAGPERKRLVQVIAKEIGVDAVYKGAPSFEYEIDYFTVDKNGVLIIDDESYSDETERVFEKITSEGYEMEEDDTMNPLSISVPAINGEELSRLEAIIESKESLLKKAIGADSLPVTENDGKLSFAWFKEDPSPEEAQAYMQLVTALCKMATTSKRINGKDIPVENEKYAFRCFLLRLGFIGDEYKASRKILLRNFSGSSAFKGGARNNEIFE